MNIPMPSPSGDDVPDDRRNAEREAFLGVFASLYDRLREGSRAHLAHAADMATRELGGVIWVQLPSRPTRRTLPEAGYVAEAPPTLRIG